MTNRLADLEAGLARARSQGRKTADAPRSRSLRLHRPRRRSLRKRVTALATVDYRVPGVVPTLTQPTPMSCWATVFTMLYSWKKDLQKAAAIEDALGSVGERWVKLFQADTGLGSSDSVDFIAAAGLVGAPPANLSIDGWAQWLRDYGPIWATTDEAPGKPWALHARVITAIKGDGTPKGTKLTILDPAKGSTAQESVATFVPKYEEEIVRTGYTRVQLIHWPKDARVSIAKGRAAEDDWSQARSNREPDDRDWYTEEDDGAPAHAASIVFQSATAKSASWAADSVSPDYQHLDEAGLSQPFALTGAVMKQLAEANHFSVSGDQDQVLFGLRGCRMLDASNNAFAASVQLSEDLPDHDDYHCVLGVWKRSTGEVAAFPGSTVPNWHHMNKQKTHGGQRANMLLTGRYVYTVGNHRKVKGAFRQQPHVVVLRSNEDLIYERQDVFERHSPADNIHPGFSPTYGAKFSSAGCMTIPGSYRTSSQQHTGKWADFRKAAGLSSSVTSGLGHKYVYLLLTGREARLAAAGAAATQLTRLRFGSSGAAVKALQMGLKNEGLYSGAIDGDMGKNTVWAWVRRQKKSGPAADGIVTPSAGLTLGFDMIANKSVPPTAAGAQSYLPTALRESFDVRYEVPLVPQQTGASCWAAAAAMLVSWRDRKSLDPEDIASAVDYYEQYDFQRLDPQDTKMFAAWGMTHEPPQSYSVQAFRKLLESYGPLWVATWRPVEHVVVVTGISGDGTPDGTTVYVNDPLEKGMARFRQPNKGAVYTETYRQFMARQAALAGRELHVDNPIYVAHLGDAGRKRLLSDQKTLAVARPAESLGGGAGVAVSAASLGYTVIKDIVNNKADPTWNLQAMDGFYHPSVGFWSEADKKKHGLKPYQEGSFEVEGAMDTRGHGRHFAKFKVEFDYNGHFVANIQLKPIGHDDGNIISFWDLHVTQTIRKLGKVYTVGSTQQVAAVKLDFTYRFSAGVWYDDTILTLEYTIYGTGDVAWKRRWSQ